MVTVVSPGNLGAGYTFTAQVDGKDFVVTVPEGGVELGQHFDVPYPTNTTTTTTVMTTMTTAPPPPPLPMAPTGRWRNKLCDCFEVCCSSCLCWQACCCVGILIGQLAQRFNLDCFGGNVSQGPSTAFTTWAIFWAIYVALLFIGLGQAMAIVIPIVAAIAIMNIRYFMRKKYKIEPSCCNCCDGKLDDLCCGCCCTCCVTIQMARHSHDINQYPYMCCEPTGLPSNAPECV
jgi:Cys-rich protein (TIGR01571 family)